MCDKHSLCHAGFNPKLSNPPKALTFLTHIIQIVSRGEEKRKPIHQTRGYHQSYGTRYRLLVIARALRAVPRCRNHFTRIVQVITHPVLPRPSQTVQPGQEQAPAKINRFRQCFANRAGHPDLQVSSRNTLRLAVVRGCPSLRPLFDDVLH